MLNSAVFLDRDGVINHNYGYVYKREEFVFMEGIFDLARLAHNLNYKLVVITNQAGIARGYYTEDQFHCLTNWMCKQFSLAGAPIEKVYFSPYHPTAGLGKYLKDDFSRKPNPGMILQAQEELSINLSSSVLVGDSVSDIEAGNIAGIGTNLLLTSELTTNMGRINYNIISTLIEAKSYLKLGIE